jgi:hypothetical protein
MRRRSALLAGGFGLAALAAGIGWQFRQRAPEARLLDVGPRLVSNQTSQPLALVGENLRPGMRLRLSAPFARTLPMTVLDGRHAYARLPADLRIAADAVQVNTVLSVDGQRRVMPCGPLPRRRTRCCASIPIPER